MTQPTPNPEPTDAPAPPGKALRIARLVIAVTLLGACAVFGVYAVRDIGAMLEQGPSQSVNPIGDYGQADRDTPPRPAGSLMGMARLDPDQYIPIEDRANPHPGEIEPFFNADAFLQPPYRQPNTAGEVWEFCAYRVADGYLTPTQAFAHYDAQAKQRGLKLLYRNASDEPRPGGMTAAWSDGKRRLELTAWPTPGAPPAQPPQRPKTPLDWVVKYSYPAPNK